MGKLSEYRQVSQRGFFPTRVLTRPVANLLLAAIPNRLSSRMTPNQISFSAFSVAQLANISLFINYAQNHEITNVGILIWLIVNYLAYVLDCADGQFARRNNLVSIEGKMLDMVLDLARELTRLLVLAYFLMGLKWGVPVIFYLGLRLFWMSTWSTIYHLDSLTSFDKSDSNRQGDAEQTIQSKLKKQVLVFLSILQDGFVDILVCALLFSLVYSQAHKNLFVLLTFSSCFTSVSFNIIFVFRRILR